jgi:putative hydrolases of HD superfamily
MGLGVEEKLLLEKLRGRHRAGWLRLGVPEALCETVRDHTLKLACAARIYPGTPTAKQLRYRLSIVHDFCECDGKDYTPYDNISPEDKHLAEWDSLCFTTKDMGDAGKRIRNDWKLYSEKQVQGAVLVSQLDKFDAAVQALEYEKRGYDVSAFFPYTEQRLTDPLLRSIFNELMRRRTGENAYRQYFRMLRSVE